MADLETISTRRLSAKIFGNEKAVEVICALAACGATATAQQIAKSTSIDHPMVRIVLKRLVEAGVLSERPRPTSRAPLYYEANNEDPAWRALAHLAEVLTAESLTTGVGI